MDSILYLILKYLTYTAVGTLVVVFILMRIFKKRILKTVKQYLLENVFKEKENKTS